MLGIVISFHSFKELLVLQIENIEIFVPVPYHIFIVDNSNEQELRGLVVPRGTVLRNPNLWDSPSGRHQSSVNMGVAQAWSQDEIKEILILDNDMVFLTEWNPPRADLIYEPSKRGKWEYCWLNLMYLKKFQSEPFVFQFYNCPLTNERTDSGGNSGLLLLNPSLDKRTVRYISDTPEREEYLSYYQYLFKTLCNEYGLEPWFDVHSLNGSKMFHFRAMSNYTNYPESFMEKKKRLVLESISWFHTKEKILIKKRQTK